MRKRQVSIERETDGGGKTTDVLVGSSIRRIAPETQAVDRGRMNSYPSPETRVTYSEEDIVRQGGRNGWT